MKIDEALDILQRAREAISDIQLAAEVAAVMADINEKSPTTITEDPATWPPNCKAVYARTDWGDNNLFLCHETKTWWRDSEPYKPLQRDDAWQYLPEWEG
jgi:hypothetical protein